MNPECMNCCNKEEKERYRDIVDTQHLVIEDLTECINGIAEIIHMQMPLEYQDEWLLRIIETGIWRPEYND
tara:strand:+ start:6018 stop:6230 length:213 start_codon:yes stop_codon:yes gene_type:complete